MAKIYAKPIPPVERMQNIQRLVRDPKESPTDIIKAAELMRQSKTPVAYTPRSLSQATTQAQLPRPAPRSVPQPKVPVVVPPPISPEDEEILMAQAGGRASIPQQVQNLSSRGRHGDTMLMHVNPEEFQGLSTLLGPTTTNPDTGLPEAFAWWLPLIGAAIGGIASKSWKGAALGGLAGLGGAFALPGMAGGAAGATVAPTLGSAGAGVANLGPYTGLVNPATTSGVLGSGVAAGTPLGLTSQAAAQNAALSTFPSKALGMGWTPSSIGQAPAMVKSSQSLINPYVGSAGTRNLFAKSATADATRSPSLLGKVGGWAKDHPFAVASGLYGLSSLAGQPQYSTSTPTLRKPATIDLADIKPKKIRKARRLTEEEINKRILEGEDPSSFLEDTDEFAPISFANTGGLLSLARHGRGRDNAAYGGEVAHINANEADMLRRMGGAGSINPVTGLPEYYVSAGHGGGQSPGVAATGQAPPGIGVSPGGPFGFTVGGYGGHGLGTGGRSPGPLGISPLAVSQAGLSSHGLSSGTTAGTGVTSAAAIANALAANPTMYGAEGPGSIGEGSVAPTSSLGLGPPGLEGGHMAVISHNNPTNISQDGGWGDALGHLGLMPMAFQLGKFLLSPLFDGTAPPLAPYAPPPAPPSGGRGRGLSQGYPGGSEDQYSGYTSHLAPGKPSSTEKFGPTVTALPVASGGLVSLQSGGGAGFHPGQYGPRATAAEPVHMHIINDMEHGVPLVEILLLL